MKKNKVLIIRFSSFGDIVQCSSVVELIRRKFQNGIEFEIDWVTRSDFENLVALNSQINRVWSLDKKTGIKGLLKLSFFLRQQNYTHIYDAHNNLRSNILKFILMTVWQYPNIVTRSKERINRILLFNFRINRFPKPFIGINSFISPLKKWGVFFSEDLKTVRWEFPIQEKKKVDALITEKLGDSNFVVLVPSAAWEMKRWPIENWKQLIALLPNINFVILGGKEDLFCEDLVIKSPQRTFNLAGKLSLIESSYLIGKSSAVISADTGLLHVADVLEVKALSLMGPTAFGFTKSSKIKTLAVNLPCRPCSKDGRGKCTQATYQKCMLDITPSVVARELQSLLNHD